jgi:hypothetical protein
MLLLIMLMPIMFCKPLCMLRMQPIPQGVMPKLQTLKTQMHPVMPIQQVRQSAVLLTQQVTIELPGI